MLKGEGYRRSHGEGVALIVDEPGPVRPGTRSGATAFNLSGAISERGAAALSIDKATMTFETPDTLRAADPVLKPYGRLAGRPEAGLLWSPDILTETAARMPRSLTEVPQDGGPAIPAAYTYFGQFLVHEISNQNVLSDASARPRSSRLDLDSLFMEPGSYNPDEPRQHWVDDVGLGRTLGDGSLDDLPRKAGTGEPEIPDDRNDSNLALAQVHVAISKFHHLVFAGRGGGNSEVSRRITRRHVQSIVLNDFVRRLVPEAIVRDVITHGRKVVYPGPARPADGFLLPIEFAAALFRIGHSMVRDVYTKWENGRDKVHLFELLKHTGHRSAKEGLKPNWTMNWNQMLGAPGAAPPDIDGADAVDQLVATKLSDLRADLFPKDIRDLPGDTHDLAKVTLLRARAYELPSAQMLAEHHNGPNGDPVLPMLGEDRLLADDVHAGQDALRSHMKDNGLAVATPLWLYALLEARACSGGRMLGPLAGRVVMETLHATVEADAEGIVNADGTLNFTSDEALNDNPCFGLHDLIAIVAKHDWTTP